MSDSDPSSRATVDLSPDAQRFLLGASLPVREGGPASETVECPGEQELLAAARRSALAIGQGMDRALDVLRALWSSTEEAATRMGELRRNNLALVADLERAERVFAEREQLASSLASRLSELAAELALQQGQWHDAQAEVASAHARSLAVLEARITELEAEQTESRAALQAERTEKNAAVTRMAQVEAESKARLAAREAELNAELGHARDAVTRAERERAFSLEEQDRFVKSVVDDYEQKLAELKRARDEAVGHAEQLARSTGPGRRESPGVLRLGAPDAEQRVRELEEQLERVEHERALSRELLRRLQVQRDEAQETTARLTRQMEAIRSATNASAPQAPDAHPTRPDLPRTEIHAAGGPIVAPGEPPSGAATSPPPLEPERVPVQPRSALAAALAASDPARRRKEAAPVPDPGVAAPPLKPTADSPSRPPIDHRERDAEPDQMRVQPPRRHGG